jgi:hypothetical protein
MNALAANSGAGRVRRTPVRLIRTADSRRRPATPLSAFGRWMLHEFVAL